MYSKLRISLTITLIVAVFVLGFYGVYRLERLQTKNYFNRVTAEAQDYHGQCVITNPMNGVLTIYFSNGWTIQECDKSFWETTYILTKPMPEDK